MDGGLKNLLRSRRKRGTVSSSVSWGSGSVVDVLVSLLAGAPRASKRLGILGPCLCGCLVNVGLSKCVVWTSANVRWWTEKQGHKGAIHASASPPAHVCMCMSVEFSCVRVYTYIEILVLPAFTACHVLIGSQTPRMLAFAVLQFVCSWTL